MTVRPIAVITPSPLWRVHRTRSPATEFHDSKYLLEPARDRYDDPDRLVRVAYFATAPGGAFLEALAPFRPSVALRAAMSEAGAGAEFVENPLEEDWRLSRSLSEVEAFSPRPVLDVAQAETLSFLRGEVGKDSLDLSYVTSSRRPETQNIARVALAQGYAGVLYPSRFGTYQCVAVFEAPDLSLELRSVAPVSFADLDFVQALETHGIRVIT